MGRLGLFQSAASAVDSEDFATVSLHKPFEKSTSWFTLALWVP